MEQTFYSNGKLLLTGEYAVLDGAKALALPTQFGQDLVVQKGKNREIHWKSFDSDGSLWFEERIGFDSIINSADFADTVKSTLVKILQEASLLNPDFLKTEGYTVETHLTFPRSWGLGTSSTLINNIAQWLQIDAFVLLNNSFGGSGYDIACAQNDTPVMYQLVDGQPHVETVGFNPAFKDQLYFVYLNKKQNSKSAIAAYHQHKAAKDSIVTEISLITNAVTKTTATDSFIALLENHENILSPVLELEKVKDLLFEDFTGAVKSLGAWGGDFVLAVSQTDPTDYFKAKGYRTVIPFSQMIL
jgi:mevalonate kinase